MDINIAEIARQHGINPKSLWRRIKVAGMSVNEAINTPWRGNKTCSVDGCKDAHEARGFCQNHYNQWYRHGDPTKRQRRVRNAVWYGRGYKFISSNPEHVLIAEEAIGKALPYGAIAHHANGNSTDNRKENLVICPSQSYHRLIHQRLSAYRATGNPNHRKCTFCKQYDAPENMYVIKSVAWHRACRTARNHDINAMRESA